MTTMHNTDQILLIVAAILAGLAIVVGGLELRWIVNKTKGDTISERTREWFKTKTKRGAWAFLITLGAMVTVAVLFSIWYAGHILAPGLV